MRAPRQTDPAAMAEQLRHQRPPSWGDDTPAPQYADERQALGAAVAAELVAGGQLESQTDTTAVIIHGPKVNHVLHLILSILTAGVWLFVWLLVVLMNRRQRVVLSLDYASKTVRRTVTQA